MSIFNKTFFIDVVFCGILGVALLTPSFAYAAEVYFKVVPSSVPNDEAAIVEAYIATVSQDLNVVEGVVRFEELSGAQVSSVVVETGGSVALLWPTHPVFDEKERLIRFVGGSPDGFKNGGLLFRMRVFAARPGRLRLSWLNTVAYRNDGVGVKESLLNRSLIFSVAKGVPNTISPASRDSAPPTFMAIDVGRDPNTYDGKYFVSFQAVDDLSGVSRYEVRESSVVTEVSNGVYVLKDQERKTRVDITVYDNAGNSKSVQVPHKYQWTVNDILIIMTVLALIIFIGWYVYSTRRKISI